MLLIGVILLVIGVLLALTWRRDAGVVLAVVGAVMALVALLSGGQLNA